MINRQKRHAFTLLELLTVMAVIAILAGMTLGIAGYVNAKNRSAKTLATIEMLKMGLEQYKTKYGFYPASIPLEGVKKEEMPFGTGKCNYIPFALDITDESSGVTDKSKKSINNFNQFVDYSMLTKPENSVKEGDYYLVKDGFPKASGASYIYYRCPGKVNRSTYDLGSFGPDGKVGDNGSGDFGSGDDITNFKR